MLLGRPDNQRLRYGIDDHVLEMTADDSAVAPHAIRISGQPL